MKRKLLSIITAFAVVFAMIGFTPIESNAQMCAFTLYVNGSPYNQYNSYADTLKWDASTNTVTLNGFYGQSIAAIPGGNIGDDDMPVLNIVVKGYNSISGGTIPYAANEYSCIYAEPRAGGYGDESMINISGLGTLNLGKSEYDFTKSAKAAYSGIRCGGSVKISGGVTVDINYVIEGLESAADVNISGINAADVNVKDSTLKVKLDGKNYYPSQYSYNYTSTTASIYGIYANLEHTGTGYTSIDTSAQNAESKYIYSVLGDVSVGSSSAAIYLKNKNSNILASGKKVYNNYSSYVGEYNAAGSGFAYKALVTYNQSNSKLTDISGMDIYKLMKFGKKGEKFTSESEFTDSGKGFFKRYQVSRVTEQGQAYQNEDTFKTSNHGDYIYEGCMVAVPKPGYKYNANAQTTNGGYFKKAIGEATGFEPDDAVLSLKTGVVSATYLYADATVSDQPAAYYCKFSSEDLSAGLAQISKDSLAYPENYGPDIKYEWHLKAVKNGKTEDVLLKDVGFATGYATKTLTIDKSKLTSSTVNIDGGNVSLSELDGMSIYCAVKSISGTVNSKATAFNPFGHIDGVKKVNTPAGIGESGIRDIYCGACNTVSGTEKIPAISSSSIKLSTTKYTYSGSAKKPSVYAKDTEGNSITSSNKSVTYKNNTKVGTATAKVTFKSKYKGTKSLTFKIVPKKATIKSAAAGTKKVTVKMGTKVSSTGGTKYQIKYRVKGTSKWKTMTTTSQTCTIKSLKKGKKYEIKVRAYKDSYYGAYSKVKTTAKVK